MFQHNFNTISGGTPWTEFLHTRYSQSRKECSFLIFSGTRAFPGEFIFHEGNIASISFFNYSQNVLFRLFRYVLSTDNTLLFCRRKKNAADGAEVSICFFREFALQLTQYSIPIQKWRFFMYQVDFNHPIHVYLSASAASACPVSPKFFYPRALPYPAPTGTALP